MYPRLDRWYSDPCRDSSRKKHLARIRKRLGGDRYLKVRQCFESALREFFRDRRVDAFYDGIRTLLEEYYDPMYRYQIDRKQPEIIFQGPETELLEWAESYGND